MSTPETRTGPRPVPQATAQTTAAPAGTHAKDAQANPRAAPASPHKIQDWHRQRLAIVYVRQSSQQQVLEHRESTALQYGLVERAAAWGWPRDRVVIIDEDQGRSAQTAAGRTGFQRLLVEVNLDHVGLILGIEMSRLARSCKDWHHLLEVCALFNTLLADQEGVYDPSVPNDRLLLGLKGTMSEAELYTLRGRLQQGRLNKAKRGALFNHAPIGYVRLPSGDMVKDPDAQVQQVVQLLFDKFDELGTVTALLRYLVRQGIRLGIRPHHGSNRGQLEWRRPCRPTLLNLLHHPIYAGAYSHGRRPTDRRRQVPGRPSTGRTVAPLAEWAVLLHDQLPAYITWERYLGNQRRLQQNQARCAGLGAPREGPSLLGGLLVCGSCNCRLLVSYGGQANRPRYTCGRHHIDYAAPGCQSLAAGVLDDLVTQQVLRALEPASLELSLQAGADIQRERDRLDLHWQQRLERATFDAERAGRQYQAVEPENRLVARTLEQLWEKALAEQQQLQEEYDRFQREQPRQLTSVEHQTILSLANDIPGLWQAETTTAADRQTIVRQLLERVVVNVLGDSEIVDVTLHWLGGFVSQHQVRRPVAKYEQLRDHTQLLARIAALRALDYTAAQIAAQLNEEGFRPPKRRATFNSAMVRQLLSRRGRSGSRPRTVTEGQLLASDEWWLSDLARSLDIPQPTLRSWQQRHWVQARKLPGVQGRWIYWADQDELDRLRRLRACPRGWSDEPYPAELTTPKPRPEK